MIRTQLVSIVSHQEPPHRIFSKSAKFIAGASLFLGALISIVGCASTVHVVPSAKVKKFGNGGFTYDLPYTAVVVQPTITAVKIEDGDLKAFSQFFLGIEPEKRGLSELSIGDVEISAKGVSGPDSTFFCQPTGGPFTTNVLTANLTEFGFLSEGSSESDNKTVDFIVTTLETTAKIAGAVVKAAAFSSTSNTSVFNGITRDQLRTIALADGVPTSILSKLGTDSSGTLDFVSLNASLTPDERKIWERFENRFRQATAEANNIKNLSDKRLALMTTTALNADVYAKVLATIDAEIELRSSRFLGKKQKLTWLASFQLQPQASKTAQYEAGITIPLLSATPEGITRFSEDPINRTPGDFSAKPSAGVSKTLSVNFRAQSVAMSELIQAARDRNRPNGYYFRIPATTSVTVALGGDLLKSSVIPIGQLGALAFLPRNLGSQKLKVVVKLDPVSGALREVKTESTAFDPSLVKRLGDLGANLTGDISAAKKAP